MPAEGCRARAALPTGVRRRALAGGDDLDPPWRQEPIRRRPYSVVLLDEIEKAHPEVFNMLLQILEDGRLADAKGKQVNFASTTVIMTLNIGVAKLQQATTSMGFQPSMQIGTS